MTDTPKHRGAASVGYLSELDSVGAGAVLYLRLWCTGADEKDEVCRDFTTTLGAASGKQAICALNDLCELCTRHGRRPLMRHGVSCKCLGADEAFFANFIGAASDGDREDAMMIATTFVRADVAFGIVSLAETFGLALKRMALSMPRPVTDHPTPHTLH